MAKVNYWFLSSVVLALVLVLVLSNLKSCASKTATAPVDSTISKVVVYKKDTIFIHVPARVHYAERIIHDTFLFSKIIHSKGDTLVRFINQCADLVFLSDTFLKKNSFKAILNDTLHFNRLVGRSFRFADLRPDTITTITTKLYKPQPFVKIYAGLDFGLGFKPVGYSYQGGVDVDAILQDRFLIGIKGGINSALEPQVGVRFSSKISLRKP